MRKVPSISGYDLNLTLGRHRFYYLAPLPVLDPICPWDNIQIYNAKYWQKMRDFIGLYHFEVIIQLWV